MEEYVRSVLGIGLDIVAASTKEADVSPDLSSTVPRASQDTNSEDIDLLLTMNQPLTPSNNRKAAVSVKPMPLDAVRVGISPSNYDSINTFTEDAAATLLKKNNTKRLTMKLHPQKKRECIANR
jgi:hypothetical protein